MSGNPSPFRSPALTEIGILLGLIEPLCVNTGASSVLPWRIPALVNPSQGFCKRIERSNPPLLIRFFEASWASSQATPSVRKSTGRTGENGTRIRKIYVSISNRK
jgi:hypothetical protein